MRTFDRVEKISDRWSIGISENLNSTDKYCTKATVTFIDNGQTTPGSYYIDTILYGSFHNDNAPYCRYPYGLSVYGDSWVVDPKSMEVAMAFLKYYEKISRNI